MLWLGFVYTFLLPQVALLRWKYILHTFIFSSSNWSEMFVVFTPNKQRAIVYFTSGFSYTFFILSPRSPSLLSVTRRNYILSSVDTPRIAQRTKRRNHRKQVMGLCLPQSHHSKTKDCFTAHQDITCRIASNDHLHTYIHGDLLVRMWAIVPFNGFSLSFILSPSRERNARQAGTSGTTWRQVVIVSRHNLPNDLQWTWPSYTVRITVHCFICTWKVFRWR